MGAVNNWRVTLPWPAERLKDAAPSIEHAYDDDEGVTTTDFDEEPALAALLLAEVVFLNDHWWCKDWPEAQRNLVSINVNTSDVFAWGCADAEEIAHHEIAEVYRYWLKDPNWGAAVWACIRHKERPQKPVEERIRKGGAWDFDAVIAEHGLRPNQYDGRGRSAAGLKYERYVEWAKATGRKAVEWTAAWWSEWRAFTDAHPGWHDAEWAAEERRRIHAWEQESGWLQSSEAQPLGAAGEAEAALQHRMSPNPPPPHPIGNGEAAGAGVCREGPTAPRSAAQSLDGKEG